MNISIEFTLTPLQTDFETPIIVFIKALRKSGYKVIETPLSTQIYGEFDALMLDEGTTILVTSSQPPYLTPTDPCI